MEYEDPKTLQDFVIPIIPDILKQFVRHHLTTRDNSPALIFIEFGIKTHDRNMRDPLHSRGEGAAHL